MSRTEEILDAIVLAGTRINGPYSRVAKTTVKGLVPIRGGPVIDQVLRALRDAPEIDRVCVVGPKEVRNASTDIDVWTHDEGSIDENLRAGIESLGSTARRILICSSDLPFASTNAIRHLVHHGRHNCDIAIPLASDWEFLRAFPGSPRKFMRLREGNFAIGGTALLDARVITSNVRDIRRLLDARRSPAALAMLLGARFVYRLYTGKLSIPDLEARVSELTQCRCRAILQASPVLAFELDSLRDYRDARRRVRKKHAQAHVATEGASAEVDDIHIVWSAGDEAGVR